MHFNLRIRDTGTVLIGMGVAQSIPLLGSLLIARLFAPAEFGIFSTWLGIAMMTAVLITGRLEMALVVEDDGEPRQFGVAATLATTLGVGMTLFVITLIAYLFAPHPRHFTAALVFACLADAMLMAALLTWQSWAAAEGSYHVLSWTRIAQAAVVTTIQIVAGLIDPSALSLALGHICGLIAGILIASRMMPISLNTFLPWCDLRPKIFNFWLRHKRFPLFSLPAGFINTAAVELPLFIILNRFGPESSGLYALTIRILGGPISLFGAAVLDVFKRSAASSFRQNGNCREDYVRTFRILGILAVVFAICLIWIAEPFFAWAFGDTWRRAGEISIWLMPMFALRFVASPLSYVFFITGGQKIDLVWQCGLLTVTVLTLMLAADFESSLKAYASGYALMYVVYLFLSYRSSTGSNT